MYTRNPVFLFVWLLKLQSIIKVRFLLYEFKKYLGIWSDDTIRINYVTQVFDPRLNKFIKTYNK